MADDKRTILVVDDDEDFLTQQELLLSRAGYEVVIAHGQAEAEELLQERRPDLAIVDLMMEHMDGGFALCYHIKKTDSSIPVILVTGVTRETGIEFDAATDEERAWIRADAMLTKPIRFEQLQREIRRLTETN